MKATCYLRIGKSQRGFVFAGSTKPNTNPVPSAAYAAPPYPTILVKLNLDLPDDAFGPDAETDVAIPAGAIKVLAEVEE